MYNLLYKCTKSFSNNIKKFYCTNKNNYDIEKLRNIGILAHIDAGKTTTTERMLFYSGIIKHMGEVHHGNTVTDYMTQERERGITIKSAAVTFEWKKYQFNLIDTPGHIDFTMEVEQTLNVLDGCIVVLDACEGVEAQTLTVWRQSDRYEIPRIIYVNKMDRPTASLDMSCQTIEKKLNVPTLCLQIPVIENSKFVGLVDVLTLEKLIWHNNIFHKESLTENTDAKLWNAAKELRSHQIDQLSELDDNLANTIIASDSLDNIQTSDVVAAVRKATIEQKVVPVVCGSSYKNIGVQPLMDSVILYLPSPKVKSKVFTCFEELSARAFKVLHDKQKGALVFFRIYSGTFNKGQKIYNVNKEVSEQSGRLYVAYADEFKEVDYLENGNIAVVAGLKQTMPGDLITNSHLAAQKANKKIPKDSINYFGTEAKIPEPVFFCSIEASSLSYQNALEQALAQLQREDPSLRVTNEEETGQTILAGMGELHLEIIKDRLLKEYKLEVDLGPLRIAYREAPISTAKTTHVSETKIGNSKQFVSITLSVIPSSKSNKEILRFDKSHEASSNISSIFPKHLLAVKQGITTALNHGPKISSQVINVEVMLHHLEVGRGTSESMIAACTSQCVQKLLNEAGTDILEPVMYMEIVTPDEYLSSVMADLSRRRASIQNVGLHRNNKLVISETPLAELLGYSTILRTLSSGTATFSFQFSDYKKMSKTEEWKAIEEVRGF